MAYSLYQAVRMLSMNAFYGCRPDELVRVDGWPLKENTGTMKFNQQKKKNVENLFRCISFV